MDYMELSCCKCQNVGGRNLWVPGRKWAHTREDGAACVQRSGCRCGPRGGPEFTIHPQVAGAREAERARPRSKGRVALEVIDGRREDTGREHSLSAECRMRSGSGRVCVLGTSVAKRSPQHVLGGGRRRTASTGPKPPRRGGSEFSGEAAGVRACTRACEVTWFVPAASRSSGGHSWSAVGFLLSLSMGVSCHPEVRLRGAWA